VKLRKTKTGKVLIILYYAVFGTGIFLLMMFIISKAGILVGLAASLVLGIVCGVIGGELEFIHHRNILRRKYGLKKRTEVVNKVLTFPGNMV